jgi:hypothetical protein
MSIRFPISGPVTKSGRILWLWVQTLLQSNTQKNQSAKKNPKITHSNGHIWPPRVNFAVSLIFIPLLLYLACTANVTIALHPTLATHFHFCCRIRLASSFPHMSLHFPLSRLLTLPQSPLPCDPRTPPQAKCANAKSRSCTRISSLASAGSGILYRAWPHQLLRLASRSLSALAWLGIRSSCSSPSPAAGSQARDETMEWRVANRRLREQEEEIACCRSISTTTVKK